MRSPGPHRDTARVGVTPRHLTADADMVDLGEYPALDWAALHSAIVRVHVTQAAVALEHLADLAATGGLNEAETTGLASLLSVDVTEARTIVADQAP